MLVQFAEQPLAFDRDGAGRRLSRRPARTVRRARCIASRRFGTQGGIRTQSPATKTPFDQAPSPHRPVPGRRRALQAQEGVEAQGEARTDAIRLTASSTPGMNEDAVVGVVADVSDCPVVPSSTS